MNRLEYAFIDDRHDNRGRIDTGSGIQFSFLENNQNNFNNVEDVNTRFQKMVASRDDF